MSINFNTFYKACLCYYTYTQRFISDIILENGSVRSNQAALGVIDFVFIPRGTLQGRHECRRICVVPKDHDGKQGSTGKLLSTLASDPSADTKPPERKKWDKSEWEAKAKEKDAKYKEQAIEAEKSMAKGTFTNNRFRMAVLTLVKVSSPNSEIMMIDPSRLNHYKLGKLLI